MLGYSPVNQLPNETLTVTDDLSDPAYQKVQEKLVVDMFEWMEGQGDFLPEKPGFMPILKADHFPLDQENRGRQIPDSLQNTLTREDYFYLSYEEEN